MTADLEKHLFFTLRKNSLLWKVFVEQVGGSYAQNVKWRCDGW